MKSHKMMIHQVVDLVVVQVVAQEEKFRINHNIKSQQIQNQMEQQKTIHQRIQHHQIQQNKMIL